MELKKFGTRSGLEVAPISIGAMRFPEDCTDSVEIIRHAIDSGMRYIDTSRGYGESEFKLGAALKDGYREKVILSSKCSPWLKKVQDDDDGSSDSVRRRIDETMLRLDVDMIDFYQVWNISSKENWELATKKGGMVEGIKKAMVEGLVGHTGFTTHAKPEELDTFLDEADWAEVILCSYNMLSKDYEPVLKKAHNLGLGTIVMNPVGGGKFADNTDILMKLAQEVGALSVPELAIRFVLGNTSVDTLLCGMAKTSDIDASIAAAQKGGFTAEQLTTINEYFKSLSREKVSFCTGCNYCMPCPAGIEIPKILSCVYEARFLGLEKGAKTGYKWHTREIKPDACTDCGECEKKCTQSLKVRDELKTAMKMFAS